MGSNSAASILDRILDTGADNLRIAKILAQMGLDPNNINYDAPIQPAAGNSAGQHHGCQYICRGWRHLSCRYLADAYNRATARREHARLYVLRCLWRALGKCRGFHCCRSMQSASVKYSI